MRLVLLAVLCACSWKGIDHPRQTPAGGDALVRGDAAAIEKLLRGSATNGGIWFNDTACTTQFPVPGELRPDQFHAFAACLAGLHPAESARQDPIPEDVTLTYAPGFEIEARIIDDDQGPRLTWIGYVSRRDVKDALPSVVPEALEPLRAAGDRAGTIDPAAAQQLMAELPPHTKYASAWLTVCVDATGAVTGRHLYGATSFGAGRTFLDATKDWAFRPFVVNGQPLPVCTFLPLSYPPDGARAATVLPFPVGELPATVLVPRAVEAQRTGGDPLPALDDRTIDGMRRSGIRRLDTAYAFCIDETGHVGTVTQLRPTGFVAFDNRTSSTIHSWVYRPFLDGGKPVPVCTVFSRTISVR